MFVFLVNLHTVCPTNLLGGFPIYYVPGSRTRRKRNHPQNILGVFLQAGSFSSGFLIWKPPNKEIFPGGGFHSIKSPANLCPFCSFEVLPEFEHSRTNRRPENGLKPFLLGKMKRPSENSEELRMSGSVWLKPRPGTAILLLRVSWVLRGYSVW